MSGEGGRRVDVTRENRMLFESTGLLRTPNVGRCYRQ